MPKVSIVLPVYNGETYLRESIQSVLDQTFTDWELIIVDDGSTDLSAPLAKEYALNDSRIHFFQNEQNIKLPATLNRGFKEAKGKYWTWTSCDNAYLPQALQAMLETLDQNPHAGLVYANMNLINEKGTITDHIQAGAPHDLIMRNVVGACFMYRATTAQNVGDYDVNLFLCEDYEYWLRMALKAPIVPIDKTLYNYRQHSKSLSAERQRDIIARGIAVQKKYYPHFIQSRYDAARFYAHLRDRDIYNQLRQFYLFVCFFYSPCIFLEELIGVIKRRF